MIILKEIILHNYKCFESDHKLKLNKDINVLVGMNESGKSSILESLAKINLFREDSDLRFNLYNDYNKNNFIHLRKNQSDTTPYALSLKLELSDDLKHNLENLILTEKLADEKIDIDKEIIIAIDYNNNFHWNCNKNRNWNYYFLNLSFLSINIYPYLPKFIYHTKDYLLPSSINLEHVKASLSDNKQIETVKALFEMADTSVYDLLSLKKSKDLELILHSMETRISELLHKYWKTNPDLRVKFEVEKKQIESLRSDLQDVEYILNIKIKNEKTGLCLPLENHSKGFNWFLSFLIRTESLKKCSKLNYVFLLDNPELSLHPLAQIDLLHFLTQLSERYQIIYATHSPTMTQSVSLDKLKVLLKTEKEHRIINDVIQEYPYNPVPIITALGFFDINNTKKILQKFFS